MLRIGWVIANLGWHGSVRRVVEMSNALVARGHWLRIYHSDGSPCQWLPCAAETRHLEAMVQDENDALILCQLDIACYSLFEEARACVKAVYVLAVDERVLPVILGSKGGAERRFREAVCRQDWLALANSTWLWEWLRANLRPDCELLLGGVNTTIFRPRPVVRGRAPVLLMTGGKRAREGSGTVAAAVGMLRTDYPDLVLQTYHGAGLSQPDLGALYAGADLFLDAQWYAGWNNAVAEAMASGTAVVCTDIGGVRDFALHGETALLVSVGDAVAMAEAALRLMRDGVLRERLATAALAKIRTFTYAAAAENLEQLLEARL